MNKRSPLIDVLIVLALMMGMGIIGSGLSFAVWAFSDVPVLELIAGGAEDFKNRMLLRLGILMNHSSMFLLTAIIFGYLFYRGTFTNFLKLRPLNNIKPVVLWGLIILVSYPIVGQLTVFNESLDIPDFLSSSQDSTFAMLENVLQMDNFLELLFNLLIVGVSAAVGEELLFRGIIQQKFQEKFGNPHVAIIATALLFGSIHMQFGRLLPLAFLGMLMGYSFYYTKNLWVPIILHFLNNSFQVLSLYAVGDLDTDSVQNIPDIPMWSVIASIVITIGLVWYTLKDNEEEVTDEIAFE